MIRHQKDGVQGGHQINARHLDSGPLYGGQGNAAADSHFAEQFKSTRQP